MTVLNVFHLSVGNAYWSWKQMLIHQTLSWSRYDYASSGKTGKYSEENEIWSESPAPADVHLLTSHCGGQWCAWGVGRRCDLNRSGILWTLTWLLVNEVVLCLSKNNVESRSSIAMLDSQSLSVDRCPSESACFFTTDTFFIVKSSLFVQASWFRHLFGLISSG